MTPFYEDDAIMIWHGDCYEFDAWRTADAMVTDPPYGTGYYEHDHSGMAPSLLVEMATAMPCAVFGYPERLAGLLAAAGLTASEWVTWWPTNGVLRGFSPGGLRRESEAIAFVGAHRLGELREPVTGAHKVDVRLLTGRTQRAGGGQRKLGDVWRDPAPGLGFNSKHRRHPNEKPVSLLAKIVQGVTREGQTVTDPFMGSGSTLLAAVQNGRRAVGVEIDEKHCETAAGRFAQGVLV